MATGILKREFVHKRITGTIEIAANNNVEKSMTELGATTPTGYTLINATISMHGTGVKKVIPHFSGERMSYVTFTNNNNYQLTVTYNIDCLYQRN